VYDYGDILRNDWETMS